MQKKKKEEGIKIKNRYICSDADRNRRNSTGEIVRTETFAWNQKYRGFPARLTSAVKRYDVKSASMQNGHTYSSVWKRGGRKELEPMPVLSHKWRYAPRKERSAYSPLFT